MPVSLPEPVSGLAIAMPYTPVISQAAPRPQGRPLPRPAPDCCTFRSRPLEALQAARALTSSPPAPPSPDRRRGGEKTARPYPFTPSPEDRGRGTGGGG